MRLSAAQNPQQQIHQLASWAMPREALSKERCGKTQHRDAPVELFDRCQGLDVPRSRGGQALAELLDGFVLEILLCHGSRAVGPEPMHPEASGTVGSHFGRLQPLGPAWLDTLWERPVQAAPVVRRIIVRQGLFVVGQDLQIVAALAARCGLVVVPERHQGQ